MKLRLPLGTTGSLAVYLHKLAQAARAGLQGRVKLNGQPEKIIYMLAHRCRGHELGLLNTHGPCMTPRAGPGPQAPQRRFLPGPYQLETQAGPGLVGSDFDLYLL